MAELSEAPENIGKLAISARLWFAGSKKHERC